MGIIKSITKALNKHLSKVVNKMSKKNSPVIVAISSASGAGTSTAISNVAKMIRAEGQEVVELNYTFTNLAEDLGITSKEIHALAKGNKAYDFGIDLLIRRRAELALSEGKSVVAGSRMADWALGGIADVYAWIDLDPEVRTERIYQRERELWERKDRMDPRANPRYPKGTSKETISKDTALRDRQNVKRYRDFYSIDFEENSFVNVRVDSGKLPPEPLAKEIYSHVKGRPGKGKGSERWEKIRRAAEPMYEEIEKAMGKVFKRYGVAVRGSK